MKHQKHFTHILETPLDITRRRVGDQRWYVTETGNKYPSVTTVLGAEEKPAITQWKRELGKVRAKKEMERCASRGNDMHQLAESYLSNLGIPLDSNPSTGKKLFNQIKPFLNKIDNIRGIELPLYSNVLKIAGTADCIAEYNGTLSLIDFKSSNNPKTRVMIDDYYMQTTAYALCYEEIYGTPIDNLVIIMGVEKGITPMVFTENKHHWIAPLVTKINKFYANTKRNPTWAMN